MTYTFEQVKKGYANLWDQAQVKPQFNSIAMQTAKKIIDHEGQLKEVEAATDVPWYVVGCMLYRESNLDFNTYLGNGQSLHRVTTEVPAGRGPFSSFLEGAIDALRLEGLYKLGPATWVLEFILYGIEKLNGFGYFSHGINSPYLWSWTTLYTHGKFTSDHGFDPNFTDPQGGCAAILKALFEIDPTLMPSRVAKGKPPMTTPAPATTPPSIDIAAITKGLETVVGFLPLLTKIFPPLAPVAPFIPLIQGGLKLLEELESSPHDPASIADLISKHLASIGSDIQAIKAQMPVPPASGG